MKKIYNLGIGTLATALIPALSLAAPLGSNDLATQNAVMLAAVTGQCQKDCPMGMECGESCATCGGCEKDCHQEAKLKGDELSAAQMRSIERMADRPLPRR